MDHKYLNKMSRLPATTKIKGTNQLQRESNLPDLLTSSLMNKISLVCLKDTFVLSLLDLCLQELWEYVAFKDISYYHNNVQY